MCLIDVHCGTPGSPNLVSAKTHTKSFWISSLSHSGHMKVVRKKNVLKIFHLKWQRYCTKELTSIPV